MMVIPFFPESSLDSSVITTVWVGVFVLAFFNLRLGWILSGLVIPGYLTPLLLVKPWAAGVILLEGWVTYAVVWFFSEYLSRWGRWSSFFGRDRFFALVLCSIAVRLAFDTWLLPALGDYLSQHWQIPFDYRANLHSLGLIIIALIANQFWKMGFYHSFPQVVTTCGITYLIVRYGLMEFTNFSISSLSYMYEGFAVSILGSPKAYIILVTTAFMASRMNLYYGWDFNGILVPSLIALQWSQPSKIAFSFLESYVLLFCAHLLLRTPFFQRFTIEGGRKLLLFFNLSFVYKLLVGHALALWFPDVRITDAYGFGYLLPTLLAIKMHDKGIAARMTRAILQTSLVAVTAASVIGISLTHLPPLFVKPATRIAAADTAPGRLDLDFNDVIRNEKTALYSSRLSAAMTIPLPREMDRFATALNRVFAFIEYPTPERRQQAEQELAQVEYRLDIIQERYLYLHEHSPRRGWGTYLIDRLAPPQGILLEVPVPLESHHLLEAAAQLFLQTSAGALALASPSQPGAAANPSVLRTPQSFFQVFHHEVARQNVLQVRGMNPELTTAPDDPRLDAMALNPEQRRSRLQVKSALPPGLDLVQLKTLIQSYDVVWDQLFTTNIQRETTLTGFAELFLSQMGVREILLQSLQHGGARQLQRGEVGEWLWQQKTKIALEGTNHYRSPQLEELMLFDTEILTPLLTLLRQVLGVSLPPLWPQAALDELWVIAHTAELYGYQLVRYLDVPSGQQYVILSELDASAPRRNWGTYVWRLGPAHPYLVQAPRPTQEAQTLEYAVALFDRLGARALLISGAHPQTNLDGSADILATRNHRSLFNLVHQVMLREYGETPMMAIQCRGFSPQANRPAPSEDAVLSVVEAPPGTPALARLKQRLLQHLQHEKLRLRLTDGSIETSSYEASGALQAQYLDATHHKAFALLWLSPAVRAGYRSHQPNRSQDAQFSALNIPTFTADLADYLSPRGRRDPLPPDSSMRPHLQRYLDFHDIISLALLIRSSPSYRFERLLDQTSKQAFLLMYRQPNTLVLIANLSPREGAGVVRVASHLFDLTAITQFRDTRARWIEANGD